MLLLEIILTVTAWRKGWRARALIPVGALLSLGFIIGFVVGLTGAPMPDLRPWALLDVLAIVVLAVMSFRAPAADVAPTNNATVVAMRKAG